ncbi:NAD-dependent succinate-semialdehyde dehydrogenase [Diaphorobacter caeni]|uniref:NAD-dependent succinate-semialdehyde dehydrogenase n=1 Tax=Diaphorobacter caeni TaxID=2784387 RepID=UPI00188FCB2C|nr:NAD-dependent succinate-semialdehyde dehydrogenase [Diaphorobacter caeni]MBF5007323.1 NAD-dependent succinate-semialdehyde dehydrogenase [Diaphorobacter caeni]
MNHPYPQGLSLLVGGEWRGVEGRDTVPVVNPATDVVIGLLPVATEQDIDDAIAAADAAFRTWSQTSAWEREVILKRAAALIDQRRDHLAAVLTLENGKPLADSQGEIDRVIEGIVYCAEECKRAYGRILPPRAHLLMQASVRRPIGPVAAFAPWNFPAFLAARKVAAALAAGCTVVLKPAEETPAVCVELVRAFVDAGVPSGVLNLLFGVPAQISQKLIASPVIRKISFTGSVPVGKLLARQAGEFLKPATMELGGHAPVLIFDDVDIEKAARACVGFKFRNAGQVCLSPSRFYVQESVAPAFIDKFVEFTKALKVGNGMDAGVQMGPLNNKRRLAAARHFVEQAHGCGAKVMTGGEAMGQVGNFYLPTVLTDLSEQASILSEEPFCPVAPIMTFSDMEDGLAKANSVEFGLAAYAFTNRMARAAEFSERIEAGWVGINSFTPSLADAPIGGLKDSGLGYEGGPEGLDAYQHLKFISQSNSQV